MKITNEVVTIQKKITIDYENGILCHVTFINDVLSKYHFFNHIFNTLSYVENISEVAKLPFYEHDKFKYLNNLTYEELISFNEFDKLYYLGCTYDGLIKTHKGDLVSTLMYIDYVHTKNYNKINTLKKCNEFVEKCKLIPWVIDYNIVEIPYYNRDNDKDTHSINYNVLLPQNIYTQLFSNSSSVFKNNITKLILNS